jgi:hypothetical protein
MRHNSYVKSFFKPNQTSDVNTNEEFYRSIYYFKPNIILIHDVARNLKGKKKYQQFFNLGKNAKNIRKLDNQRISMSFDNSNLIVKQFTNISEVNFYNGSDQSLRGYIADGSLKIRKGNQIEFVKLIEEETEEYITLFSIEDLTKTKQKNTISIDNIKIRREGDKIILLEKEQPLNLE